MNLENKIYRLKRSIETASKKFSFVLVILKLLTNITAKVGF